MDYMFCNSGRDLVIEEPDLYGGWTDRRAGRSYFSSVSLDVWGRRASVKVWVSYPGDPRLDWPGAGWADLRWFGVEIVRRDGILEAVLRLKGSSGEPNRLMLGDWSPESKCSGKWDAQSFGQDRLSYRLNFSVEGVRSGGRTVRLRPLPYPEVAGGLPTLGKRR